MATYAWSIKGGRTVAALVTEPARLKTVLAPVDSWAGERFRVATSTLLPCRLPQRGIGQGYVNWDER